MAHEAYSTRPTDKHGRLYTVSNALDGKDPLGKSQENWAISENGKYAQMNIYFDTYYNISAVTLYGEEGEKITRFHFFFTRKILFEKSSKTYSYINKYR